MSSQPTALGGCLKGALLAESIVVLFALGFFVYFGLGPTPRDYDSSWQFAGVAAMQITLLGTPIAAVFGGLLGALAVRLTERRIPVLVGSAAGACLFAILVIRAIVPLTGILPVVAAATALSMVGALGLERWTRRDV